MILILYLIIFFRIFLHFLNPIFCGLYSASWPRLPLWKPLVYTDDPSTHSHELCNVSLEWKKQSKICHSLDLFSKFDESQISQDNNVKGSHSQHNNNWKPFNDFANNILFWINKSLKSKHACTSVLTLFYFFLLCKKCPWPWKTKRMNSLDSKQWWFSLTAQIFRDHQLFSEMLIRCDNTTAFIFNIIQSGANKNSALG